MDRADDTDVVCEFTYRSTIARTVLRMHALYYWSISTSTYNVSIQYMNLFVMLYIEGLFITHTISSNQIAVVSQ
jgi:hypothetical protein